MFVQRVRAVAIGAQAVQRGHAHGRGEVGVAAAASHGGVFQGKAGVAGRCLRAGQQGFHGLVFDHGRAVHLYVNLQLHVGPYGAQGLHLVHQLIGGAQVGQAEVHHAAAAVGHGVGGGAAFDGAHAHRHAACVVGHGLQCQDLVGHFADGAAAFVMLHTGVGGAALHAQAQHAGALARGDALAAVGAGRLAHQAVARVAGKGFDVRARCVAAGFFVRHHQKVHRQRGGACGGQVAQRRQGQVDTGLHVIAAGAVQAVAFGAAGVLLQRADGVHGVGMAQDEQAGPGIARRTVADVQQRPHLGAQRRHGGLQACVQCVALHLGHHARHAFGIARGGFALHPGGDAVHKGLGGG